MKRKPYDKYKKTGIEWIEEIPEHWDLLKIRRVIKYIADGGTPKRAVDEFWNGDINWLVVKDIEDKIFKTKEKITQQGFENSSSKLWAVNDLIISLGATIGEVGIAKISLCTKQGISGIKVDSNKILHEFLFYYLKLCKPVFKGWATGTTIFEFRPTKLKDFFTLLPPLPEQKAIALYLDKEINKTDLLIKKQEKLIGLLYEKRDVLISNAVTKGLNSNVKLKPTGIQWIGDAPEHWEIAPLKRIVKTPITDGPHETPQILDTGIPFVSAEAIKNNKIDFFRKRGFISVEDHRRYSLKYKPEKEDIYMIKSGATTGNLAIVETDEEFNIWSPLAAIRINEKIALPKYIFNSLNSNEFQTSIKLFWSYGTQQNIGMNVIENLLTPLPPLSEQKAIAAYLDKETEKTDDLINKAKKAVEKLKEYKQAIISAAVTGKIKVP
ncbi:MAG: restriction endonuclease subunit S [Deltaproteobacteria bacterium]|nr:restriction endonuclease subunit S [Deltaproteobacteria bacterium]